MISRTWHLEMVFVATALGLTVSLTRGGWVEIVGACAVLLSFCHAQVADRLAEHARATDAVFSTSGGGTKVHAYCWRWARRYLVGKELLWLAYFIAHQSWAALVGVGVFLAYPLWRRWYRRAA